MLIIPGCREKDLFFAATHASKKEDRSQNQSKQQSSGAQVAKKVL